MIDYFNITINGKDLPTIGKSVETTHLSTTKTQSFTPHKIRPSTYAQHFEVRIENNGETMRFYGCPLKWIQGHNGLGSNEFHPLVAKSIALAFKALNLPMPASVTKALHERSYIVHEVHVAEHYRMPVASIPAFCDNIRRNAPAVLGVLPMGKGIGIRIWTNSRDRKIIMYDKHHQLQDSERKHRLMVLGNLPKKSFSRIGTGIELDMLKDYLEQGIRIETRFKRSLNSLKLNVGSAWNSDSASRIHHQMLDCVLLTDLPPTLEVESLVQSLANQDHRRLLALWSRGLPLREFFNAPATYFRFRKLMLGTHGIDVSNAPVIGINDTKWTSLIAVGNKLETPAWAYENGFVFDPLPEDKYGGDTQLERAWLDEPMLKVIEYPNQRNVEFLKLSNLHS